MTIPRVIARAAVVLVLVIWLVFPASAVAQHSASASETVRFAVVPVHTPATVLGATIVTGEKVTVSLYPTEEGLHARPWTASSLTLRAPVPLSTLPARRCSVVVTITD